MSGSNMEDPTHFVAHALTDVLQVSSIHDDQMEDVSPLGVLLPPILALLQQVLAGVPRALLRSQHQRRQLLVVRVVDVSALQTNRDCLH